MTVQTGYTADSNRMYRKQMQEITPITACCCRLRGDNVQERAPTKKSGNFTANPSTGVLSAKYFKQSQSGTLLAESSTDENSLTVTNAEIAKYSQVYMVASWTERETVNFL